MDKRSWKLLGLGIVLISYYSLSQFNSSEENQIDRQLSQFTTKTPSSIIALPKAKNKINKLTQTSLLMSDPAMSQAWGHHKIDIKRALNVSQGEGIVIAVIDTGIDLTHPDLRNNLWVNPGETGKDKNGNDLASNGIDDDKNGCIDDIYGCNTITGRGDFKALKDNHGHGTHISGIIAAEGGNGVGITGVAPKAKIMTLKYFDPKVKGANNLLNTIKAVRYAVAMKKMYPKQIKKMIINYSGGGAEYSEAEKKAVSEAQKAGILFVAAAGNERSYTDDKKYGYYPAGYELDNVISITATNITEKKLESSNFGTRTVDIAAPGGDIFSTFPGGQYGPMTGTSQATAFATGVAALIMSKYPDFSAQQVKKYILKTGDSLPSLRNYTGTSKRLNSYRALVTLDSDVSAMGSLASNTAHIPPGQWFSDQSNVFNGSESGGNSMADFGRNLANELKKNTVKKKITP